MTWQLANGLGSGSVISVNFLKVPVAEADLRFGAQSGLKSDIARAPKSANSGTTALSNIGEIDVILVCEPPAGRADVPVD
jgi:hypothetical protein